MDKRRMILRFLLLLASLFASFLIFLKSPLYQRGGWMMIPLIFTSIFSFGIIFGKMRQFSRNSMDVSAFLKNVFELIERQRIKEAIDACDASDTSVARVIKAGIMKYDRPKDDIREALQNAFLYEVPRLEVHLSLLSTLADVVPLLGFAGTLSGLMKIFQAMEAKSASLVALAVSDVAPGLWEALLCAAAGFLLAIPLLIAHNYLTDRVNAFAQTMEISAAEFLAFLMDRRVSA